jgi:hypothetical protein
LAQALGLLRYSSQAAAIARQDAERHGLSIIR